jgi:hypothetical protein
LLFEAEKRIDVSHYDSYQKRVLAFLAERLLGVYVYHHKLKAVYYPIYFITNPAQSLELMSSIISKLAPKKIIKFILPYGVVRVIQGIKNKR